MTERIKRLTNLQESVLVVVIGLGLFIFSSIQSLLAIYTSPGTKSSYSLNEGGLIYIFAVEVIALSLIAFILVKRGWKLAYMNLNFSFRAIIDAILILLVTGLISGAAWQLVTSQGADGTGNVSVTFAADKSYFFWMLVLSVNSIFEEVIYVGYLSKRLEKFHPSLFIILSSVIRTIVHLYQGIFAVIPHFITGLIFSSYYVKCKNLATLIIAHTLWNLLILWRDS